MLVDADGHVRRSPLLLQHGERLYPSLALSVATQVLDTPFDAIVHTDAEGNKTPWHQARFCCCAIVKSRSTLAVSSGSITCPASLARRMSRLLPAAKQ
jgi:hypothetical protein